MENLTKEVILQAIQKIKENPELVKGRESSTYDLILEGEKFPPILVLSEANKLVGGKELFLKDFASAEKAFKYLKDFGFIINEKKSIIPNFWFVYQGSTFTKDKGQKFLWAPILDKRGNKKFFWENMKNIKEGDIIFNYSNKAIKGISIATNSYLEAKNPDDNSQWGRDGYKVDIDCNLLDSPIESKSLLKNYDTIKVALSRLNNKPFTEDGRPNQGYLYEFTLEAARIIRSLYGKPFGISSIDKMLEPNTESILEEESYKKDNIKRIKMKLNYFDDFHISLKSSGLLYDKKTTTRFVSSLLTKPFIILTGLSGSGKTKLAQAFSRWICASKDQYCIVPVGADWTNREPLLGYPNALSANEYVKPDNGVLDLLIRANKYTKEPHFLILDEMNLSHVERYFADFLSVMESNEEINLYSGSQRKSSDGVIIPQKIGLPENLFIIGTVNIDETTYMFSPKVLDRANVIEFRVSSSEIDEFLTNPKSVDLKQLDGKGSNMTQGYLELALNQTFANDDISVINKTLVGFFNELKKLGAEFGYRSANEIVRLINQLGTIDNKMSIDTKIDIAIMQKLLPKLHGSRRKLCPVLLKLGEFCLEGKIDKIETEIFGKDEMILNNYTVKYPISLEKIIRMYKGAVENGFASYAEA